MEQSSPHHVVRKHIKEHREESEQEIALTDIALVIICLQ